jgi:glutaminyl-tRNA synthetase
MDSTDTPVPTNFIIEEVARDLQSGRFSDVRTRLPPEPSGYLHIGHVKAFLIDYNTAKAFGGELILRFDDTNPAKEETEFVEAIEEDCQWLGIHWVKVTFASDYFDRLYEWAIRLVKKGLAYVDDQSPEEMILRHQVERDRISHQARHCLPLPGPFGRRKP